ncbi:P-loop containing nucleoside triphosphate hydrolase protein [Xylariaceae sp. FL0804]|nr:P-loop containing nucleoside triphosphate hydrolase protein [Xylariaceae sp. FL0804]
MRKHVVADREKFAKYAIDAVLAHGSGEQFKISAQTMEEETVTLGPNGQRLPEDLIDAIRAEGQHVIDKHDVDSKDLANATGADHDMGLTQKIGAAAQAMISASPNSLGPPVDDSVEYLKAVKCGEHGRNKLTVWKSPLLPQLDNQEGRRGLLDNQVTAIVWLLSRFFGKLPKLNWTDENGKKRSNLETEEDKNIHQQLRSAKYFGAILADSMGLGKTLITTALLDLLSGQGLNILRNKDGNRKYCPSLVLTPNYIVTKQWVAEIDASTEPSNIRHIVVSGRGTEPDKQEGRVVYLDPQEFKDWPDHLAYMWDQDDPRAAQAVLVVSIDTWSLRTCFKDSKDQAFYSSFTELGRRFSLVVVDEAYKVKNSATQAWRSVDRLEREFTLLITATPVMNTLTDLLGLARLLWKAPRKYLESNSLLESMSEQFKKPEDLKSLDRLKPSNDLWLAAGWPALLAEVLGKPRTGLRHHNIELTREYLKYFESLAILRRSPSSCLFADRGKTRMISLEGLFPVVGNYTISISPSKTYEQKYQEKHIEQLIEYMETINEWGAHEEEDKKDKKNKKGKKKPQKVDKEIIQTVTSTYRLLDMASSSLEVLGLHELFSSNEFGCNSRQIGLMREAGLTLPRLARFLLGPEEQEPETCVDYIKLAARKSPTLRAILDYISRNILDRDRNGKVKKLMIVESIPMLAFYYEMVLQLLGFNCRTMHASLSPEEREELIISFNESKPDTCQILIQMYTVGFAGTNLHKNCSRVLVASQAPSLSIQWQAIHRVIRVGQTSNVTVHRILMDNSYHAFRESRQVEKILPEMGSRARGGMEHILVRLLNLFQVEVDEAWASPEAQTLMKDKNLLIYDISDHAAVEEIAEQLTDLDIPYERQEKEGAASLGSFDGYKGWFNKAPEETTDDQAFLTLRTRTGYYREFKELPKFARSFFSHKKNSLRRLLSYGFERGERRTRPWTVEDLRSTAVLERALELLLRVRLGAREIAMLPHPQIDFSLVPAAKRGRLYKLLADSTATNQDFENAVVEADPNDNNDTTNNDDPDDGGRKGSVSTKTTKTAKKVMKKARTSL